MIVTRRLAEVDPLGVITASFAVAALLLAPRPCSNLPTAAPSPDVVHSLAVLGVACTALAFVAFVALIAEAGAARASVIRDSQVGMAIEVGRQITRPADS